MTTKFERDKVYKTRDGREARVICVDASDEYPIVGIVGRSDLHRWRADGSIWVIDTSRLDLMLPKPEPVVEWGLKVEDRGEFFKFTSKADAERWLANPPQNAAKCRLAKRTTEIVE